MTIRKRILLVVAVLLLALLGAILWPKPCVQYGGMVAGDAQQQPNCHCEGFLWTEQDDAPADGFTIKKCIGLALWPAAD